MSATPLRTAVVGLREPGLQHAACVAGLPEQFRLVGGCDPAADARAVFQSRFPGATVYSAFGDMLAQAAPDVVVLATGAAPRCSLTLQAVEAGVRGIFAEKPIAVGMGEARAHRALVPEVP